MNQLTLRHIACIFAFFAVPSAHAQTGKFSGKVSDPSDAAVRNAEVHIYNLDSATKIDTKTDGNGEYLAPFLPAGHYRIEVEASGFAVVVSDGLTLSIGETHIQNIKLGIAGAQSNVNVNTQSDITEVNTQNSELASTLTGREVAEQQLNGRNFTQLIALAPGVSNQTQQDEARVGAIGSVAYSVNGGRTEYNSFSVDGSEALNVGINKDHSTLIVYPSVDAISEIKILTSNYGAQYPSNGNGTTIVTTKSGTDKLHGNLYEFFRNEALNAKGYFDVTNGPPLYRRHDFGGTVGGAVFIPKLYDSRGKTFFFFSEEARLEKSPTAFRQAVPSLAERNGDFNDVCPFVLPGNPGQIIAQNRTVYPDCPEIGSGTNALQPQGYNYPSNRLSVTPAAAALLNTGIIPAPNSHVGCNSTIGSCYLSDVSLPTYFREELLRLDHALSGSEHLSIHYIHDEWDTTTPVPQYALLQNSFPTIHNRYYGPGTSVLFRLTSELPAKFVNEVHFSYTNSFIKLDDSAGPYVNLSRPAVIDAAPCQTDPVYDAAAGTGASCGLGSIFSNGSNRKLPGLSFAGSNAEYGGSGFNVDPAYTPWSHSNPTYTLADNVSRIIGHHSLSFGGLLTIFQRNQLNGPIGAATGDTQGLLTFNNEAAANTSGNQFADFLLMGNSGSGGIANYQQDSGQARYHQQYKIFEPYLQDDWKVSSGLTVNAGLRISAYGTYKEKNHHAYNWVAGAFNRSVAESIVVDPASGELVNNATLQAVPLYEKNGAVNPQTINGIVRCGVGSVPDGCMTGHLWNVAPRVGFAWDPQRNGKTAVRAGYGVFFEHGTADEANTGSLEGSAPLVLSETQSNPQSEGCIGNAAGCGYGPGAFPLNVTAIPTRAVWPYIQQYSFSIEKQLPRNLLITAAYTGSKGTHLTAEREINQLTPLPAANNPFGPHEPLQTITCASSLAAPPGGFGTGYGLPSGAEILPGTPAFQNIQVACFNHGYGGKINPNFFRTFAPGLGNIYSLENIANSSYNSLQATSRYITSALTFSLAYTYSHSLDDASDRSDSTFVNSADLKSNKSSSSYDQRHLLHISYDAALPIRSFTQKILANLNTDPDPDNAAGAPLPESYANSFLAKLVLDDWRFSGITLFETGIPFTVINNGSPNGISVLDNAGVFNGVGSGSYPDLVGNPHSKLSGQATAIANGRGSFGPILLNPSAFAAPRGLTFGNAGRNSLNNPRRWNFDVAAHKVTPVREGMTVEFRAEAFNVFNHTQFRIYDPTLGNQGNNTLSCYGPTSFSGGDIGNEVSGDKGCLAGSSFLHPVDAHRPRTIQFGLKLAF